MRRKNKINRKALIYIWPLFFAISSCSLSGNITVNNGLIRDAVNQEYDIYYRGKHIDNTIVRLLKKEKNIDFQLADPEEPYNPTDMHVKGLPSKRLIMMGKGNNDISIVLYQERVNQGYMCLIYQKSERNNYFVSGIWVNEKVKSIADVIEAIKSDNYRVSLLPK
jgi:hypothetical protein